MPLWIYERHTILVLQSVWELFILKMNQTQTFQSYVILLIWLGLSPFMFVYYSISHLFYETMDNPKLNEWTKLFIKYCIVGGFGALLIVLLLWIFIDKLAMQPRNIWRIGIIGFVFILRFFLFKLIGFSK